MKITLWDGKSPVQGIPVAQLRASYPLPAGGSLALVWSDDQKQLLQVADRRPVGGAMPITSADIPELQAWLEAQQTTGPATGDVVTREEFNQLMTMILEG